MQILEHSGFDGHHWHSGSSFSGDQPEKEFLGQLKRPLFLWMLGAKEVEAARRDQEWESPWNVEKLLKMMKKKTQESDQKKRNWKSKRRSARIRIRFQFHGLR